MTIFGGTRVAGSGVNATGTTVGQIPVATGINTVNWFTAEHTGDAIQYVSTSGNDSNDGFSLLQPKQTLAAAFTALPAGGGSIRLAAGTFNLTATLVINKANVTIEGTGIDATTINMAIAGSYAAAPTGTPTVSATGTTLSGSQTLPANTNSVTLNVASTTNVSAATTVFIGGPTDSTGYGTANTRSYPFATVAVTSMTSTTITGTVSTGGGVTYNDQAVVLLSANGIQPSQPNFKLRDLTIDGSAGLVSSGTYPLNLSSGASDSVIERCRIVGYGNNVLGPNLYVLCAAPRVTWRHNRSPVRFNASTCVDCRAHDNIINATVGTNQMFQIGSGANNIHIYNNYIKNTVALNCSAGQANGIRVNGTVTTSTLSANAAQGATSVTVTSVSGWSNGQTLLLANNLGGQSGVSGPWETRTITNIVGSVVSFTTPLGYPYSSGAQASAITYANDIYIRNNRVINTLEAGIAVSNASHSFVNDNYVSGSGILRPDNGPTIDNVDVQGSHDVQVNNNRITHCGGYGINVSSTSTSPGGSNVRVIDNKVLDCGDPAVTFQAVNDCSMEGNEIVACPIGVAIGEADSPAQRIKVAHNIFRSCDWMGFVIAGSSGCVVKDNDFLNCAWQSSLRAQGDSVGVICDGHWIAGSAGSIGNKVIHNTVGRTAVGSSASSLEAADLQVAQGEGAAVWLNGIVGVPFPSGGSLPKYFVRSITFGSNLHTTTNGSVTLPNATIAVTSTAGFSAGGGVIFLWTLNTLWSTTRVTYTGISGNSFTGCAGGSGTFTSGSQVADSTWPTILTGWNEIRDNYISHTARRTPTIGQTNDVASNNYVSANSELIFDFETTAGTVGGTGTGALNADHTQGTNSYQLNTTGSGQTAFAVFSTGLASGWLANIANLPEDAVFEIDLKLLDANLASASFRFAQDTGSTNVIDSGPLYFFNSQVKTPHLEPSSAGWVTYRWRKGDMTAGGTATWSNVVNFELSITAQSGLASSVRADNLVVVRAG